MAVACRRRAAGLAAAALAAVLLSAPAAAMQGVDTLEVDGFVFGRWDSFQFESGGRMQLSLALQNPQLYANDDFTWLLACTNDQLDNVLSLSQDEICTATSFQSVCFASAAFGNGNSSSLPAGNKLTWNLDTLVPSADSYQFIAASCTPLEMIFSMTWHYTNPGGEELSAEQIPLKPASSAFAVLWALLFGAAGLAMLNAKLRGRGLVGAGEDPVAALAGIDPAEASALASPVRSLHWALLAPPVMYVITSAIYHNFWTAASASGTYDKGLRVGAQVLSDLGGAALLAVILLVSRGWQITRLKVDSNEARHVVFIVCLYLFTWLLWQLFPSFLSLFPVAVVYMLVLRYVFTSISFRLRMLRSFRDYVGVLLFGGGANSTAGGGAGQGVAAAGFYNAEPAGGSIGAAAAALAAGQGEGGAQAAQPQLAPGVFVVDGQAFRYSSSGDLASVPSAEAYVGAPPPAAAAVAAPAPAPASAGSGAATVPASHEAEDGQLLTRAGGQDGSNAAAPARRGAAVSTWQRLRSHVTSLVGDASRVPNGMQPGALTLRQIRVLKWFRTAIVVYLLVDALLQMWAMLALDVAPTASYVLSQLMGLTMVGYLMWIFRARPDVRQGPLYDPRGYGYTDSLLVGADEQGAAGGAGYGALGLASTGSGGGGGLAPTASLGAASVGGAGAAAAEGYYTMAQLPGTASNRSLGLGPSASYGSGGAAAAGQYEHEHGDDDVPPILVVHNPDSSTVLAEATHLGPSLTGASVASGGAAAAASMDPAAAAAARREEAVMAYARTFYLGRAEGVGAGAHDEDDDDDDEHGGHAGLGATLGQQYEAGYGVGEGEGEAEGGARAPGSSQGGGR